jgi:hypothetical protein
VCAASATLASCLFWCTLDCVCLRLCTNYPLQRPSLSPVSAAPELTCALVHTRARAHAYTYTHARAHTHTHTHKHAHTPPHTHAQNTCIQAHAAYSRSRSRTHTRTHLHAHTALGLYRDHNHVVLVNSQQSGRVMVAGHGIAWECMVAEVVKVACICRFVSLLSRHNTQADAR